MNCGAAPGKRWLAGDHVLDDRLSGVQETGCQEESSDRLWKAFHRTTFSRSHIETHEAALSS